MLTSKEEARARDALNTLVLEDRASTARQPSSATPRRSASGSAARRVRARRAGGLTRFGGYAGSRGEGRLR